MKEEVKTTPRAHAELIKKWAEDGSLNVYQWIDGKWQTLDFPIWSESSILVVAKEKPTEPPKQNYRIITQFNHIFIDLPIGLSQDELEKEIKQRVIDHVKYTYEKV